VCYSEVASVACTCIFGFESAFLTPKLSFHVPVNQVQSASVSLVGIILRSLLVAQVIHFA